MQSIEFTGFDSVNEATHPEKLKPNELAVLDNMVIDKEIGMISTRNGFAPYSQPDTSGVINNLFDVQDANQNNYLLANIGTKLRKFFSASWSDVITGLTPSKMRMAAYGSSFIFTNGIDKPFYTDLTNTNDLAIARPDISGITGSVTEMTESSYITVTSCIYILVYLGISGQKSNCSNMFCVYYNPDSVPPYGQINLLANLPVSSDSRVVQKQLFRADHVGDPFYLVETVANSLTTYTDVTPKANLDSTETIEYLTAISSARYVTAIGDRITLAYLQKLMTNRVIAPTKLFEYLVTGHTTPILIANNVVGSLSAGTYKYAVSFYDVLGNESELIPYVSYTTLVNLRLDFNMFSVGFTTPAVVSVNLYRTKANGSTYYLLGNYVITYMAPGMPFQFPIVYDGAADSTLTAVYPATAHNPTEVATLPSSLIYSNLYNYSEYPELNYLEVYPDDTDSITGIFDDDNGIMVFKENSICKIYTNGDPSNWQVVKLVHNMGCDQPDSIVKRGNIYYFVFRNKVYEWAGSGEPKLISYTRKPTFDSVTSFQGAAFYNAFLWYVLTVKIGTVYYLLCYDTKLDTWYKFSISKADTVFEKIFGTDKGKLLFGGNLYITYYKDGQTNDTDSGTNDITVALKSKDFSFPDNFVIARLMFLFLNYLRLVGSASKVVNFTITDAVTGNSINLDDADETVLQPIYKIVTDGMDGDLKRVYKLNFSITGEAISKFFGGKLEYNVEPWRILRKYANQYGRHVTDDTDKIATDDTGAMPLDDGTAPSYDIVGGGGVL